MAKEATVFLLVEDDKNDVFLVQREFKSAPGNLRLEAVRDGVEAIRYLEGQGDYANRSNFPLPQVILLDLKMPRIDGFQFLEWVRRRAPNPLRTIPVVVMSSSSESIDVTRAYVLGVNSYMVKPIDWESFQKRIRVLGIYWADHVEKPQICAAC